METWCPRSSPTDPGTLCPDGYRCENGSCELDFDCPSGWVECDGECVDLSTDVNNCGSCGQDCGPGFSCVAGQCSEFPDGDNDGWTIAEGDCNDDDASVHPGANEVCDGKDNDCDGDIDPGCVPW